MSNRKIVLVTGIANSWGRAFARKIIIGQSNNDQLEYSVIGLDSIPPEEEITGIDFVRADLRNPLITDLLKTEKVEIVCHLAIPDFPKPSGSSSEKYVLGTMKLLGACAEAGVRKIILKSSTMVYGAYPNNPSFITEENSLKVNRSDSRNRQLVEIETFCKGFRKQAPEMLITILRFANIIGPQAITPLTRYLKEPIVPMLMGFDPRMQIIHENDVVDALFYVTENDTPGIFNVAAEGVLPLSKLLALTSKIPIPIFHPLAYLRISSIGDANDQLSKYWLLEPDFLRYSWVGDLTKMRQQLRFKPVYTAEEALREFAREQRLRRFTPEARYLEYDEASLRKIIERRHKERESDASELDLRMEEKYNDFG